MLIGMSLLVGSILFMGAVTGEANHQPHVPEGEIAAFRYTYGSSFIMLTLAFCLDEISGVLSVYLFIIRHKESVKKRHAKLTAHKSKADHITNYFRRKTSRNYSMSSNGEASRRSSHMPDTPQEYSAYSINRDTSHITMLTTIESHNNLQSVTTPLMSNHINETKNSVNMMNNIHYDSVSETGSTVLPLAAILPPDEFMTSSSPAHNSLPPNSNHSAMTAGGLPSYDSYMTNELNNRVVRCKTTSV